jgi:hypothetical protein
MANLVRARASRFFRDSSTILISFHVFIAVLLMVVLGLIEFWHVVRMVVR